MGEFTGKVQALGRVAIPQAVRDTEGIKDGDYVKVSVVKVGKK